MRGKLKERKKEKKKEITYLDKKILGKYKKRKPNKVKNANRNNDIFIVFDGDTNHLIMLATIINGKNERGTN